MRSLETKKFCNSFKNIQKSRFFKMKSSDILIFWKFWESDILRFWYSDILIFSKSWYSDILIFSKSWYSDILKSWHIHLISYLDHTNPYVRNCGRTFFSTLRFSVEKNELGGSPEPLIFHEIYSKFFKTANFFFKFWEKDTILLTLQLLISSYWETIWFWKVRVWMIFESKN